MHLNSNIYNADKKTCAPNGRGGGVEGLESFLEDIAFLGYAPKAQAA